MTNDFKVNLGGVKDAQPGNPVYEYIKKEDIEGAFRDALVSSFADIQAQITNLVNLYSASAPSSLWTWDFSSRWDYDFWG